MAEKSTEQLANTVRDLMPRLTSQLCELIAIPSVSSPGYPRSTHAALADAEQLVTQLLLEAGCERVERIELPDTAPVVFGEIPAPDGAPTVLLYSHYDVVPAGDESLWETPPFEPTERDGAIYGRGAADTKSNIVAIVGALRAWGGRPPVGVKVVVEGQEEVGGGAFTTYPQQDPDRFAADVMLIADLGNVRPGSPTLTVALRGMANVVVEVRTLASAKHSGSTAVPHPTRCSPSCVPSPHCTTTTATSPSPVCGGTSGRAAARTRRSSASSPRSSTARR